LIIVPGPNSKKNITPLREMKSKHLGSLVSINAIVVRTTDVKPFIKVASYACDVCGYETYQIITGRVYMPLVDCPSKSCKDNQTRGKMYHQTRLSKFLSIQEIRIQEPTDQVPVGHVPRSITVIATGECTKQCAPGDSITIHGIYLPSVATGRSYAAKVAHETYI
jgi:DNA replication licensing factor MCM7